MKYKRRRIFLVVLLAFSLAFLNIYEDGPGLLKDHQADQQIKNTVLSPTVDDVVAIEAAEELTVKGRAPKTDYSRDQFGSGWANIEGCDVRNRVLQRDLSNVEIDEYDGCIVFSGILNDPYTGNRINFVRGPDTSSKVQIDHVVALSDAWQKGAQQLSETDRLRFANDGLNLLASDGPANMQKGGSDAASWLPPNKSYRCRYVARQIAIKIKYSLWVTKAEKQAISRVLGSCPDQRLPVEDNNS